MNQPTVSSTLDSRGVLTLSLGRPERHNAFNDVVIAELNDTLARYEDDSVVRVLVLRGEGRSFSAGADLAWMASMAEYDYEENLADAEALAAMLHRLNTFPAPSIARVQGAAIGGGVGLVSCCDIAIGTPQASFMLSEVRLGLIPATISPYVIAAIGEREARRYFITAERIDAVTAYRIGMLTQLVTETELDSSIEQCIVKILANGPVAVRAAKRLVLDVVGRAVDEAIIRDTSERIASIRVSAEGQEGVKAFLEKRDPSWRES